MGLDSDRGQTVAYPKRSTHTKPGRAIFIRKARWWILFLGPLVVMVPCLVFGDVIGQNGNMLFVALFLILLTGLYIYYPVLCLTGLIVFYRRSRAKSDRLH